TNVGSASCALPTGGFDWRPLLPPVVLGDWPAVEDPPVDGGRFTTVATWRGPFGPLEGDRRRFRLKGHAFRNVVFLPRRVDVPLEVALGIHPSERADLDLLSNKGWALADPVVAAGTPEDFRAYVAGSMAEFSVAQGVYVESRSGWFSDRTARYLASGRPA